MGRCKYGDHNSGSKPHESDRDMRRGVQAFRDANAEVERQKARVAELRARMASR